jgi:hypothetical protein
MNAAEKLEVAKTIKSQIKFTELMAIGAKNFLSLSTTDFGGLLFDASLFGRKKCKVAIILTAEDLYNVCVFSGKMCEKVVGSAKGVFCESLEEVVVSIVEKHFAK